MLSKVENEQIAINIAIKHDNTLIIAPTKHSTIENDIIGTPEPDLDYVPPIEEIVSYKTLKNCDILVNCGVLVLLDRAFDQYEVFIFLNCMLNPFEIVLIKKLSVEHQEKKFIVLNRPKE